MKNGFLTKIASTLKKRPALALKYDSSMALYAAKEDETPMHEKSMKGNVKIDIVAFFAAFIGLQLALRTLLVLLKRKKKNKNKTKK